MRRRQLSRPFRLALAHELLAGRTVFDYGCGRGDDLGVLSRLGIKAAGWDPVHRPDVSRRPADIVNLGYVVNVIEDPTERADTLRAAWALAQQCLVVSARLHLERDEAHVAAHVDGYLTRRGTFQKFYEQEELRAWIEATLATAVAAAGPGVFYVFRDEQRRQAFLASRFSRPVRTFATATRARQAEAHHDVLAPVVAFLTTRGRPPIAGELGNDDETRAADAFGTLRRAARTALLITNPTDLEHAQQLRRADLLVYLALGAFAGRGRLADLDTSTRHDIKTFFPSYRDACEKADRLLFAAGRNDAIDLASRASTVGKLTPAALYVHTSTVGRLPAVLRVYEGCAQVFIGTLEDANIIKLERVDAAVSYLTYPDFDRDPHPTLAESLHVDLQALRARRHDYRSRSNPPILHRKEAFVADDYPRRATFARLTNHEERVGLYADTTRIGTRDGWQEALKAAAVELRGHRLVTTKPA